MATSTVTSKGQTTIPKEIRDRLNLHAGDRVEFVVDEDGRVVVLPATVDAAELAGMLKPPSRAVSVEEMNRVIRKRGGRRCRTGYQRAHPALGAGRSRADAKSLTPDHASLYTGGSGLYQSDCSLRIGMGS